MISACGYDLQPTGPSLRLSSGGPWKRIHKSTARIAVMLMRQPGRIVSYAEIATMLWPAKRPVLWQDAVRSKIKVLRDAMEAVGGSRGSIRAARPAGYFLWHALAPPPEIRLDTHERVALELILAYAVDRYPDAVRVVREAAGL